MAVCIPGELDRRRLIETHLRRSGAERQGIFAHLGVVNGGLSRLPLGPLLRLGSRTDRPVQPLTESRYKLRERRALTWAVPLVPHPLIDLEARGRPGRHSMPRRLCWRRACFVETSSAR